MKKEFCIPLLLASVLLLGIMGTFTLAPAQSDMQAPDPLAGLKNALQNAGATALTSEQESSINALITTFRSTHQPSQNTAVQNAQSAYETAILNGDSATAASQAAIIANAQSADMAQRQADAAVFAIGFINILKTESGQVDALIAKLGSSGFVRMVLSLVGGPGGGPGGPGGPGRGGPPPGAELDFVRPARF